MASQNDVLLTFRDGAAKTRGSFFVRANVVHVRLDIHENLDDNFAVIASSKGCSDAGFLPVQLKTDPGSSVDMMLAPRNPVFNFGKAPWDVIKTNWPQLNRFLSGGNEDAARQAFDTLREGPASSQASLACLLNIAAALRCLSAKVNEDLLAKFIRMQLVPRRTDPKTGFNEGLQQDRFFAWVDPSLKKFIGDRSKDTPPAVANAEPGVFLRLLHGEDADASYKEILFGEANLQFTFHSKESDADGLIKVEMDMDYYKDAGAHIALEVIPNAVEKWIKAGTGLTNPATVYALRWMAGKHLSEAVEFDPLYTLQTT